jgi:hypothetical protein
MLKAREPDCKHQLKGNWEEAARFASYCLQIDSLDLRPWEPPPMEMGDDKPRDESPVSGRVAPWALRRRLIKAGLSVYEPDPIRALETVAARQRGDAPPEMAEPTSVE